MTQLKLLPDRDDAVLADFLKDRGKLLADCSALILLVMVALTASMSGETWQIWLMVMLLELGVWYEFYRLIERVQNDQFGEHGMDHELLDGYFASRGIRIERMQLD